MNEMEFVKAKLNAQMMNDELVVYSAPMDGIHVVLMMTDTRNLLHGDRFVVTRNWLAEQHLPKEAAYEQALANLKALPFSLTRVFPDADTPDVWLYQCMGNDGFEAARILLLHELDAFAEFRNTDGFYAIPTTDMLLVFDAAKLKPFGMYMARSLYDGGDMFKISPRLYPFNTSK